ncbi:MAG: hypothetical protein SF097_23265 [Acidobacteriota bacterium]|nr:hypothetical protein [Acidobacteriota bacterium]
MPKFTRTAVATLIVLAISLFAVAQSSARRKPVAKSQPTPIDTPTPNSQSQARAPQSNQLPLRRAILYSNGVAYFERRGMVSGRAEINLSFKQSQVDDVLKSLVVLDLGKGRVGEVSYNSSAPPSARLNEIPFSVEASTGSDATGGLAGVLEQLQGARIAVTANNRSATGSILTIGERQIPALPSGEKDKPAIKTHTLVIATESGELQSFDLTEVRSVKLLDDGTRQDIAQFADASASARRRDAKTITINSDGEAQREMVVSYTVAAPIWKTTYRVVLDPAGKPFFQGWAVVDNVGEEDWESVSLSLVSGTPVSFIQQIQKPLYRYRPVIPIPEDLNLDPQVYDSSIDGISNGVAGGVGSGSGVGIGHGVGVAPPPPKPLADEQLQQNSRNFTMAENSTGFVRPTTSVSSAITSGESGVEAAATGSEVGELFEYRIEQPVTVRRDRSALIPILQTKMEGERVSVYNEAARKDRPMTGIRLKNTSPLTLEGGSLTVLDGDAYAGEALMERLKAGEQRFISFGLDLSTLVTTKFKSERRPVFLVRAQKGIFEAHYYRSEKKTYTLVNQTDKKRTVYIEHPLREGWALASDTQAPASKTVNHYRFRVELEPRQTLELPVTETQALMDSYQISNLSSRDVELFVTSNYIDAAIKAELEKLIELKTKIFQAEQRVKTLEEEAEEISQDQKRLRDNIGTLKNTAEAKQLVARYIAKAGEQETRLEAIAKEKREAQAELARLSAEFDTAVRGLKLERKP